MKMYTNSNQTAKLIELGFEKPKGWCVEGISSRLQMYKHKDDDEGFNYSIGELVEILPEFIDKHYYTLNISIDNDRSPSRWLVEYFGTYRFRNTELIDALYDMIIALKEEGVI